MDELQQEACLGVGRAQDAHGFPPFLVSAGVPWCAVIWSEDNSGKAVLSFPCWFPGSRAGVKACMAIPRTSPVVWFLKGEHSKHILFQSVSL